MYTGYFGLKEAPFTIAPNPAYLFMSDRHKEALAHLTYGLGDNGGFILLTGEVGTGKTTICRTVMEQLPDNTQAAFILNPTLSCEELLATLCDELKIRYKKTGASIKYYTDKIHQKLLENHEKGINTLLVIDEAQHLQAEVLEQLRLLTNLETNTKKLLQVILIGQPELQQLLQRRDLRQLAQRITARYHLMPLTLTEVEQYIKHRLSVAECVRPLFNRAAIKKIHQISKGIPRVMNLLCERSLINAFNTNDAVVNAAIVRRSAVDALGPEAEIKPVWLSTPFKVAGFSFAITAALFLGFYFGGEQFPSNNLNDERIAQRSAAEVTPSLSTEKADSTSNHNMSEGESTEQSGTQLAAESTHAGERREQSLEVVESLVGHSDQALNQVAISNNVQGVASVSQSGQDSKLDGSSKPEEDAGIEPKEEEFRVLGYQAEEYKKAQEKNTFTVTQDEGVSDELLARFQSAIKETDEGLSKENLLSEEPTSDLFAEIKPLHEMPESLKSALPDIEFQMHIFASDGKGWVRVNGADKYQGDEIDGGVVIDEILPQSVVLSFQGETFTMAALSSW